MHRFYSILAFFFLAITCFAQRGERHYLEGTRVSLVIPDGFKPIEGLDIGITKGDSIAVMVVDMFGQDIEDGVATLTKEYFLDNVDTLLLFKDTLIDGVFKRTVRYLDLGNVKIVEAFGDSTFSCVVLANAPIGNTTTLRQVIDIINSIEYNVDLELNAMDYAGFTMGDSSTSYQFSTRLINTYIYTRERKSVSDSNDVFFEVMELPREETVSLKEVVNTFYLTYKQSGMEVDQVVSNTPLTLDGESAYELEVDVHFSNGDPATLYILATAKDDGLFVLKGAATRNVDRDKEIVAFRELVQTFRFKN